MIDQGWSDHRREEIWTDWVPDIETIQNWTNLPEKSNDEIAREYVEEKNTKLTNKLKRMIKNAIQLEARKRNKFAIIGRKINYCEYYTGKEIKRTGLADVSDLIRFIEEYDRHWGFSFLYNLIKDLENAGYVVNLQRLKLDSWVGPNNTKFYYTYFLMIAWDESFKDKVFSAVSDIKNDPHALATDLEDHVKFYLDGEEI